MFNSLFFELGRKCKNDFEIVLDDAKAHRNQREFLIEFIFVKCIVKCIPFNQTNIGKRKAIHVPSKVEVEVQRYKSFFEFKIIRCLFIGHGLVLFSFVFDRIVLSLSLSPFLSAVWTRKGSSAQWTSTFPKIYFINLSFVQTIRTFHVCW